MPNFIDDVTHRKEKAIEAKKSEAELAAQRKKEREEEKEKRRLQRKKKELKEKHYFQKSLKLMLKLRAIILN